MNSDKKTDLSGFAAKCKPWDQKNIPKKVLFIRMQALGDTLITLPYISGFASEHPDIEIDFLTRGEVHEIPLRLKLFRHLWIVKGGRNMKLQALHLLLLLPFILLRKYDVVIDLQNHRLSKLLRKVLRPQSWSEFDKYSPNPAGKRTHQTIRSIGLRDFKPVFNTHGMNKAAGKNILIRNGWNSTEKLFVINPAGAFETRNWPIDYFVEWINLVNEYFSDRVLFIILGVNKISEKAHELSASSTNIINLVGKTSVYEAFSILQNVHFMLSEDSGLMHMAWTSGIPTLAIFGSTRSDWSRPLGAHTRLLDSSDLDCGGCLLEKCKYSDNRCLTRYTPDLVLNETLNLLDRASPDSAT